MTYDEARDAIQGLFREAWNASAGAVNGGSVPTVFWQGVEEDQAPPADQAWARVSIQSDPSAGDQKTLAPAGSRVFEFTGIVTVQIFTPLSARGGLKLNADLVQVALEAFQGVTSGELWFRAVRPVEAGSDRSWYQTNVLADFEYDHVN